MLTIYEANECSRKAELIRNRAKIVNEVLGYGYTSPDAVTVTYPRGAGYGEYSVCGFPLWRWPLYDMPQIVRVLGYAQAVDDAILAMAASGHLYWF